MRFHLSLGFLSGAIFFFFFSGHAHSMQKLPGSSLDQTRTTAMMILGPLTDRPPGNSSLELSLVQAL